MVTKTKKGKESYSWLASSLQKVPGMLITVGIKGRVDVRGGVGGGQPAHQHVEFVEIAVNQAQLCESSHEFHELGIHHSRVIQLSDLYSQQNNYQPQYTAENGNTRPKCVIQILNHS